MTVKAVGPLNAKIVLVGEAPGKEEELQGIPFVGASGKLLTKLLLKAGIKREECYITNVMDKRPPNNDFSKFTQEELKEGYQRVRSEVERVKPNLIVLIGTEALRAFTDLPGGITSWRGSIIETKWGKALPTLHPAYALREPLYIPQILVDLKKAFKEMQYPEIRRLPRMIEILSFWDALMWTPDLHHPMSFDIETVGQTLTCFSFAQSPMKAVVFPFREWPLSQQDKVLNNVRNILEDEHYKKYMQGGSFDVTFLRRFYDINVKGFAFDTMLGFNLLYAELPKGLDFLCSIYTDQPFYKDLAKTDLYKYNGLDAMITFEVAEAIIEELREAGQYDYYLSNVHPLIDVVCDMQCIGVRIDKGKMNRALAEKRAELKAMQNLLNEAVGYPLNPLSSLQVKKFVYEDLGFSPVMNRKTNRPTVDEDTLNILARKTGARIFKLILDIRHTSKLISSYLEAPVDDDLRMRCSYNIAGTKSGRFASHKSITGSGTNLQNVPEGICREVFVPDEGNIFLSFDLSQAEARVVAYLANCVSLIEIFQAGGDIHTENAKRIFKVAEVTPKQRQIAKRLVHGANYGIGWFKFSRVADITAQEAKRSLLAYYECYPEILSWHQKIREEVSRTKMLKTPFGRIRRFLGRLDEDTFREAYSFIPQSTVVDVLNQGLLNCWRAGYHICLQLHDSFLIQVPEFSDIKGHIKRIKELMDIPIDIEGRILRIPVDVKVGSSWGDLKNEVA